MKKRAYTAPEAEVLRMGLEQSLLTLSDTNVTVDIDVTLGDGGYGPVSGGYEGNWE